MEMTCNLSSFCTFTWTMGQSESKTKAYSWNLFPRCFIILRWQAKLGLCIATAYYWRVYVAQLKFIYPGSKVSSSAILDLSPFKQFF